MAEAALERPFYLLWQEAVRRQTGPVVEELLQQEGGNPSRLLAEAAAGRFYDLLWEEMKGRSAERGGVPGIALLESETMPRDTDGDADKIAESDKPYLKAAETFQISEKSDTIDADELVSRRESGSKVSSDKVPSSADVDGLYRINLPRDEKKAIISRGISEETAIFAVDNEDNHFASYVRNVPRKEGFYDVALHGSDTSVEFFGTRIDAYTLSQIVRQRKDYKPGTPVRLLSCNTGNTDNTGDCVAQIIANELGVVVEAPTEILYVSPNGVITIGDMRQGEMKTFYPRK